MTPDAERRPKPQADAYIHEPDSEWYLMMWRDYQIHRPIAMQIYRSAVRAYLQHRSKT